MRTQRLFVPLLGLAIAAFSLTPLTYARENQPNDDRGHGRHGVELNDDRGVDAIVEIQAGDDRGVDAPEVGDDNGVDPQPHQ